MKYIDVLHDSHTNVCQHPPPCFLRSLASSKFSYMKWHVIFLNIYQGYWSLPILANPTSNSIQIAPNCIYTLSEIIAFDGAGQPVAVSCIKCGSQLVKEKVLASGQNKFHPLKVYFYKSIQESLQCLLSCPGFSLLCSTWKTRKIPQDILEDIYDGSVWKSFSSLFASSDKDKMNLGLMINCDWFQPFKCRSNNSVGALYAVVVNLPWSMRFKPENVLLIGILLPLSKEPASLKTFLHPVIKERQALDRGVEMKLSDNTTLTVMAELLCALSDIHATRKLCGFLGHSAILGCSKCSKKF